MSTLHYYEYPIRILVTQKNRPVILNASLPANLKKLVGIKVIHSGGINLYGTFGTGRKPTYPNGTIGWVCIELNNRSIPLGNLDVCYAQANEQLPYDYLDLDIPLQQNAIITGVYNNIFNPDDWDLVNRLVPTVEWINYIVTLYLKCTKEHD